MRKSVLLLAALALVAAGCGGSTADAEPGTTRATVDESTTSSTADGTGSTGGTTLPPTSTSTTAPPAVDGPPAPDFALALADGSEFVLSAEQKPVYMVFWAEW